MILVSACLLGCACRYDGQSKPYPLAQELALAVYEALDQAYHEGGYTACQAPN